MSKQAVLFGETLLVIKAQVELTNRRFAVLEAMASIGFDCLKKATHGTHTPFPSLIAPYLLRMGLMQQESSVLQKHLAALKSKSS